MKGATNETHLFTWFDSIPLIRRICSEWIGTLHKRRASVWVSKKKYTGSAHLQRECAYSFAAYATNEQDGAEPRKEGCVISATLYICFLSPEYMFCPITLRGLFNVYLITGVCICSCLPFVCCLLSSDYWLYMSMPVYFSIGVHDRTLYTCRLIWSSLDELETCLICKLPYVPISVFWKWWWFLLVWNGILRVMSRDSIRQV